MSIATIHADLIGDVHVVTAELPATGLAVVNLVAPTSETPLRPDEARALAVRLIEAAHRVEKAEEVPSWP